MELREAAMRCVATFDSSFNHFLGMLKFYILFFKCVHVDKLKSILLKNGSSLCWEERCFHSFKYLDSHFQVVRQAHLPTVAQ